LRCGLCGARILAAALQAIGIFFGGAAAASHSDNRMILKHLN
jgi:hypothetical protein